METVDSKPKFGTALPGLPSLVNLARFLINLVHLLYTNKERQESAALVHYGKRLHQQGMVSGTAGNLSVRLGSDRIMITPSGVSKAELMTGRMVIVNMRGDKLSGTLHPSSELEMHLTIYALRPDIQAVVHAHPCTATAFASAGLPLDEAVCSEIVMTLGSVPLARYATPGTSDLSQVLTPFILRHDAILMANHGVVTYGQSLRQAFLNMELVEHFAKIMLALRQLGHRQVLSDLEVRQLERARSRYHDRNHIA
jgi:L-fuculose-phosphate aldolase